MIEKARKNLNRILDRSNRPPLLTLHIYKRHVLMMVIVVWLVLLGYGAYFRFFMVLPQGAATILPEMSLDLTDKKILILSPHCDDEILSSAGLIQRAQQNNSNVRVVITTDCNSRKIGTKRQEESKKALESVGIKNDNILFWNLPEKDKSSQQNIKDSDVYGLIKSEVESFLPDLLLAPHFDDTHIDHKIVGSSVAEIIEEEKNIKPIVAYYLIHYNFLKYPSPSGFNPDDYLLPPVRLIGLNEEWFKLTLSGEEIENKKEAIFMYKSQLSIRNPILQDLLLDFIRQNELFMIKK
ncbi:MAG: glucosamine-6-phosphate deaminase-like protein [bacterium ADurb.Bin212]|nr:MAG: glucosamine-6-phosphate deaminase-like protein [bacterium ADurb.Bin212]